MPFVTGRYFLSIAKLREQANAFSALAANLIDRAARERVAGSAQLLLAKAAELETRGCNGCHAAHPDVFDYAARCADCPCSALITA